MAAFLGNDPSLVHYPASSPYFAIHIIMERSTAKSMDCFAEYAREESAQLAVARFAEQARNGKRPRIGDRHVRVELSSQEQLMSELFPKTKCVHWNGQDPTITAPVDAYSSHFKGFITSEELVMTIRWAEHPGRVSTQLRIPRANTDHPAVQLHLQAFAACLRVYDLTSRQGKTDTASS